MKTDILYVLKKQDKSTYEDLRYSLRSIDKNCLNVGKVYLVGAIPTWINTKTVTCIPYEDHFVRKHKNILDAIMHAVSHSDIGGDSQHGMFMYSSDDHFYIKANTNMEWGASPVWFCGDIHSGKDISDLEKHGKHVGNWLRSMVQTRAVLSSNNFNCLMLSQHANTWFSRELMNESRFGNLVYEAQNNTEYGCEPSCLMGNYMLTRHPEWIGELKHRKDLKIPDDKMGIDELCAILNSGRECVSGSDMAAGGELSRALTRMFPDKCRYEK